MFWLNTLKLGRA